MIVIHTYIPIIRTYRYESIPPSNHLENTYHSIYSPRKQDLKGVTIMAVSFLSDDPSTEVLRTYIVFKSAEPQLAEWEIHGTLLVSQ